MYSMKMLMIVIAVFVAKTQTEDVPDICHVSSYNKNVLWAKGCDYPAVAFEKTTSVNYVQCITNCLNSIACTHFGFDGISDQCWLKNMLLGSKGLISSTAICGFIPAGTAYSPVPTKRRPKPPRSLPAITGRKSPARSRPLGAT